MRLIDADELKSKKEYSAERNEWVVSVAAIDWMNAIDAVQVVHARWIEDDETQTCSHCGEEHEWGDYRASYCDTCGAKMDGKETLCYEKTYKRNQSCDLVDE